MQDIVEIEVHAEDLSDGRLGILMLRNGAERFTAFEKGDLAREDIMRREIAKLQASGKAGGTATIFHLLPEDVSDLAMSDLGAMIRPLGAKRRAWIADLFLDWSTRELAARAAGPDVPRVAPSPIVPVPAPPTAEDRNPDPDQAPSPASSLPPDARAPAAETSREELPRQPARPDPARDGAGNPDRHSCDPDVALDPIERLRDALHKVADEMRSAQEAAQRLSSSQDNRSSTLETSLEILSKILADLSRNDARLEALESSIGNLSRDVEAARLAARPSLSGRIFKHVAAMAGSILFGLIAASIGAIIGWHYGSGIDALGIFENSLDAKPLYEWRDVPRQFDL